MSNVLCDFVPFLQFKKREKHLWRSIIFSKSYRLKPATLLKVVLLRGCFSRFLIVEMIPNRVKRLILRFHPKKAI